MGYFVEKTLNDAKKEVIEYVTTYLDDIDFLEQFLRTYVENGDKVQINSAEQENKNQDTNNF